MFDFYYFINLIFKKIIEIPDPLPALEAASENLKKLQKAADAENENQKLRDTINGYKKDFAEMKGHEPWDEKSFVILFIKIIFKILNSTMFSKFSIFLI